jgi:thymidylate synthase
MNNLDKQYQQLLQDILDNGVTKQDRTGTGTISVFGRQIRHKMSEGFPLLTTKKMAWKTMVVELLWFLRGDTNIKYLVDNNCHIWDGDAYKNWCRQFEVDPNNFDGEELSKGHGDQCWGYPILDHVKPTSKEYKRGQINAYLEGKAEKPFFYLTQEEFINKIKTDDEFAERWGSLGPVYGKQWRSWTKKKMYLSTDGSYENIYDESDQTVIDQISILINDLKTNPDSRRLMVNAWNVGELDQMVLPPCHYGFQVYTRELSLEERTQYKKKRDGIARTFAPYTHQMLDGSNIPTRAISLMWNQRSVDTFLGLPFNIASYGLLLEIIAKSVNMIPDELIGNLGDVHLYSNHIEQAKEQIGRTLTFNERYALYTGHDTTWEEEGGNSYGKINGLDMMDDKGIPTKTREPYPLPTLKILDNKVDDVAHYEINDFVLEGYQSHPTIKAPLSN